MEELTDEADLVRQIASAPPGKAREAESELCRRVAPRVRLYGLRHLRDEHAAADLTQEVMMILLQALRSGRVREPGKLVSFVLGTCRMAVLDIRRGSKRRERLLGEYARDAAMAAPPAPLEIDRELVTRCLERLAERDRGVIVLSFYEERTSAEVGAFFGVSTANVRVLRHRALARVRECLGASGGPK